jgi:MYXO-CTERM domain-containing protein
MSFGGIFVCDSSGPDDTIQPIRSIQATALWVPLASDALQPGDVLFWSNSFQDSSVASQVEGYALWRYSEFGGTEVWLENTALAAFADTGGRASLDAKPLEGVGQLSFSPDGTKVCFTDNELRLWVLSLAAGRPTALSLERATGAVACRYDRDGTLAVLTPTALEVPGQAPVATGLSTGAVLARAKSTWLVQAVEEPALCITNGTVVQRAAVSALFAADDLVYFIDARGHAGAASVEAFCAGTFQDEFSTHEDLWLATFNPFNTNYRVEVPRGTLVRRPDGEVLYGAVVPYRIKSTEPRRDPTAMHPFLWRLRPTWAERVPFLGLGRHADWRRNEDTRTLVHPVPKMVSAMDVFPGALPTDWGRRADVQYLGATPPPYVPPTPQVDAGVPLKEPDAGTEPTPMPTGCGCQSVDGANVGGLVLAWLAARRKRQRPPGDDQDL